MLTFEQKEYISKRKLKVGGICMLPRWGFTAYASPNYGDYQYFDTNPFTKSLDNHPIQIVSLSGSFVEVKFLNKRFGKADKHWWMLNTQLEQRDVVEKGLLLCVCIVPFMLVNAYRKVFSKGDTK